MYSMEIKKSSSEIIIKINNYLCVRFGNSLTKNNSKKMKKIGFVALAIMMLTASCSSDNVEEQGEETVTLRFSGFELQEELITRADADVSTIATRLDVWITDGESTQAVHQQATDAGYGTVAVTLNKTKTYTIYAVAHKANGAATLADGVISFPDEKVTHSFYYTGTFSPAETTTLSCRMNRIVSQFRLETTDAVPDDVVKFRFLIPQTFTRWSVSGEGINKVDRVSDVSITSLRNDGTAAITIYIIGSDTQNSYNITVQALDGGDNIIQQRIINNVPVRNNYKVTATGAFFIDSPSSFSFLTADWDEYANITF